MKKGIKLTRKEQRKQKRKEVKIRRNEFFAKKKLISKAVNYSEEFVKQSSDVKKTGTTNQKQPKQRQDAKPKANHNTVLSTEQVRKKEQKEQVRLQKDMEKQRVKQLLQANVEEDRLIRQLEKDLGLKKRKSKSLPKYFTDYGLDYLLEVCDSEGRKEAVAAEQGLHQVNDQFDEDFALMTEQKPSKANQESDREDSMTDEECEYEDLEQEITNHDRNEEHSVADEESSEHEDYLEDSDDEKSIQLEDTIKAKRLKPEVEDSDDSSEGFEDMTFEEFDERNSPKRKLRARDTKRAKRLKHEVDSDLDIGKGSDTEGYSDDDLDPGGDDHLSETETDVDTSENRGAVKRNSDGTWEDIYGRLRSKDGSVIQNKPEQTRYVPPALRQQGMDSADKKLVERMNKLRKQLKGLINRLAESNMHSIASQIEELYMKNSRNDMNNVLTNLVMESVVSEVVAPERLLIEHVVLITVLHANVGTEVGAHFLQQVVKNFDKCLNALRAVEDKSLGNVVNILAQLYNFKLFDCKLIFEVLEKLSQVFDEKCVECILHILRAVGFSLRKDDPLALKTLILDLQKRAAKTKDESGDNARVNFMLDVLLAIKNNNVKKIPNYDTSYSEHLKKAMKGFIRKSNYITQLNISLEDLLKADQRGKWWVVGSAWTGNEPEQSMEERTEEKSQGFSGQLLEMARKQRMNTDARRNVFCILMSAEDYMDAFEKILKLGLKGQQEREIINVVLHCCLQEKKYNPYYGFVAQKFCDYHRRFQMTVKCCVWDKLKALEEHSGQQLSNLARLLTHLLLENGLAVSALKTVRFGELDGVTLRFLRQIMIGVLSHEDEEACLRVFVRVAKADRLRVFRESLRLFIHHFLLRNLKETSADGQGERLRHRAKLVEKLLSTRESKL